MIQKLITVLIVTVFLAAPIVGAASYSTDATMSLQKDEGTFKVDVRVARLFEKNGKLQEQLVAAPRIISAPGVPATLYTGLQPTDPGYAKEDNVTVDVSWPYPNETGMAFCAVTIKRGSAIVSKCKLQLNIQGPGRTPLIVAAHDVDPKSVQVVDTYSQIYVLLEFSGKLEGEVKKIATENYGNKIQIQDSHGHLTDGGLSFGTYNKIGMALQYNSEEEAKQVASILRGEKAK